MSENYEIPIITDAKFYDANLKMVPETLLKTIKPTEPEILSAQDTPHKASILADVLKEDLTRFCQTICDSLDNIETTKNYELNQLDLSVAINGEGKITILSVFSLGATATTTLDLTFKKKQSADQPR